MKYYNPTTAAWLVALMAVSSALGVGEERYYGGSYDGYGDALLLQSDPLEFGARFAGGSYDGYGAGLLLQSDPLEFASRFSGGSYDGYGDGIVTNQPSPLLSDSDGDQLVDWWELVYVDGLAILYGPGDHDGDGATDLHELIADTIPTGSNSFFHITSIEETNSVSVTFTCTNSRIYSLETTVSLLTNGWHLVTGQTNVQGEADGSMSLVGTNPAAPFRAYRVRVSPP